MRIQHSFLFFLLGTLILVHPGASFAIKKYQCVSYVLPLTLMAPSQEKKDGNKKEVEHVPFIKAKSSKVVLLPESQTNSSICKRRACFKSVTYYALWIYDSETNKATHSYHGRCDSNRVFYSQQFEDSLL